MARGQRVPAGNLLSVRRDGRTLGNWGWGGGERTRKGGTDGLRKVGAGKKVMGQRDRGCGQGCSHSLVIDQVKSRRTLTEAR